MNKLSISVALLAFLAFVGTAQAAWRWEGKLVDGRAQVTASVSENGKHLRIACKAATTERRFR